MLDWWLRAVRQYDLIKQPLCRCGVWRGMCVIASHDTVHLSTFPSSSSSMSTADVSIWPPVSMLFTTALAKYPAVIEYLDEMNASRLSLSVIWLSCGEIIWINSISAAVKKMSAGVGDHRLSVDEVCWKLYFQEQ